MRVTSTMFKQATLCRLVTVGSALLLLTIIAACSGSGAAPGSHVAAEKLGSTPAADKPNNFVFIDYTSSCQLNQTDLTKVIQPLVDRTMRNNENLQFYSITARPVTTIPFDSHSQIDGLISGHVDRSSRRPLVVSAQVADGIVHDLQTYRKLQLRGTDYQIVLEQLADLKTRPSDRIFVIGDLINQSGNAISGVHLPKAYQPRPQVDSEAQGRGAIYVLEPGGQLIKDGGTNVRQEFLRLLREMGYKVADPVPFGSILNDLDKYFPKP